ncbi:MAG: hypothetical protein WBG05_06930 [Thermoanaerobaculia bacterium]
MNTLTWWLSTIRRDESVRLLPIWVVFTALNTSALVGAVAFRGATTGSTEASLRGLAMVLWFALVAPLVVGRFRRRCTRLDLALPLGSRDLWLAHTTAIVLAGAVVLAASIGVVALHSTSLKRAPYLQFTAPAVAGLAIALLAAWVLAAVLLQSYRPELKDIPGGWRYAGLLIAIVLGVAAVLWFLSSIPIALAIGLLALAWALATRTLRSLPPALSLVSRKPADPRTRDTSMATSQGLAETAVGSPVASSSSRTGLGMARLVSRLIYNAPPLGAATGLIMFPFIALIGMALSGIFDVWFDDVEALRLMWLPFGAYGLFSLVGPLTYRLNSLDPLPISRRLIFALLTLPALLAFCLGYGLSGVVKLTADHGQNLIEYRIEKPYYWVDVPEGFFEIARDGEAPTLTSPWGESHVAWSAPLFRGSRAVVYSPFNTVDESSADFEAWLTSRAIEAVYGRSVSWEEIRDRYFQVEGEQLVGLKAGGFTLAADYGPFEPPAAGPEFPFILLLVAPPFLLLTAIFLRTFRAGLGDRARQAAFWAVAAGLVVFMLGIAALMISGLFSPRIVRGVVEVMLRHIGESPVQLITVWVASLLATVGTYFVAQRQFLRAELPPKATKLALIDWTGETAD